MLQKLIKRTKVRSKRRLVMILAFGLISHAIGVGQATSTSLGPAPGELVDVGGHKMHIRCIGPASAGPTVIFEAGGGGFSKGWAAVQDLLVARIRSCAYDRAGLGWSEAGPGPRTMNQESFELHALLQAAKVPGPFVLVGQSTGGLLARLYTERYGEEVAGIVLVDSTDEDTLVFNLKANRWVTFRELATGRTIPPPHLIGLPSTGYKPEDDYQAEEAQLLYLHRKETPETFRDRPLFVLSAGKRPPPPGMKEDDYKDLRRMRDEQVHDQTKLSRNSKFSVAPDAGHNIQIDNPRLVASAIEEVSEAVKNHEKLDRRELGPAIER